LRLDILGFDREGRIRQHRGEQQETRRAHANNRARQDGSRSISAGIKLPYPAQIGINGRTSA
jgi:hypothetical protein